MNSDDIDTFGDLANAIDDTRRITTFAVLMYSCTLFRLCCASTRLSIVVLSDEVSMITSEHSAPIFLCLAQTMNPAASIKDAANAKPTHSLHHVEKKKGPCISCSLIVSKSKMYFEIKCGV